MGKLCESKGRKAKGLRAQPMTAGCRVLMRMDDIIEYYERPCVSTRDMDGFFVELRRRKPSSPHILIITRNI